MGRKRKESNIASVMYSYVGTDDQFDDFLKMMIHDYLSVDHPYTNRTADFVHDRHTIAERNDYESLALLSAVQR